MARRLGRRKFLLYGSATLGTSLFLKACTTPPAETTTTSTATTPSPTSTSSTASTAAGNTITVGILHSLSGTMAISEKSVVDAEKLAIDEINAAGGVLGKKIEPIVEDGSSDWPTFAEKAKKLLDRDKVAAIIGCYTSASRKSILPVLHQSHGLRYYPTYYEGQEQ